MKRSAKNAVTLSVATLSLTVALTTPTAAATIGTETKTDDPSAATGGPGYPTMPYEETPFGKEHAAEVAEKLEYYEAVLQRADGKISEPQLKSVARRVGVTAAGEGPVAARGIATDKTIIEEIDPQDLIAAKAAGDFSLSVQHYGQSKKWYCGPASGIMIVKYLDGSHSSAYSGAAWSQSGMGDGNHMNTNNTHSTDFSTGRLQLGINRWRGVNSYSQFSSAGVTWFKGIMLLTLSGLFRPMAVGTLEPKNGIHYNGHPQGQTIGHWIVNYKWTEGRARAYFRDPASSIWAAAANSFSYPVDKFVPRFNSSHGVVA